MKVKIVNHHFCKRSDCSFKGKTGEVESTCDEATKDIQKSLWVRLDNGVLAKFLEIDFMEIT